jgi:hypothetical protein
VARKQAKALLLGGGDHPFDEFAGHPSAAAPANDPWAEFKDAAK